MAPLEIDVGLEGDAVWLAKVAERAAVLMRERMIPELSAASPKRTRKMSKGWRAVASKNRITIVNTQFYAIFQRERVERKFERIIAEHVMKTVAQAVRDVGLPDIRDEIAKGLRRAAAGSPMFSYHSGGGAFNPLPGR